MLAPGRWLWLRALAWALGLFAVATVLFLASFQLTRWVKLPSGAHYDVALLLPAVALALYALAVRVGERREPSELAWARAPGNLAVGGATGFAFMALSLLVLWALGLNQVGQGKWHSAFFYFVFNSYISAVVEELGFRAILLRISARVLGPVPGLVISTLLFALAHAGHAPPVAVGLLIINGGLLLGVLYMVSGNLWLPIGAHLAYDFTEWSLFGVGDKDGLLVVTPSAHFPAWLTGGSFGPDGSVLSAPIALLLIAGALWMARARSQRVASPG